MLKRYTIFILLFTALAFDGFGQILTFEFAGIAGSEASVVSNTNDAGLTSSTITRGGGLTASGNGDRFNATGWETAGTINTDDYMEFTITPNSGKKFSVSSVVIKFQRSGTGPMKFAFRSSKDSYATNLDAEKNGTDVATTQTFTFTFASSDNASAVTFRFYGYGAEAGTGSGGIGDFTGNDIVVNGSVADLPIVEPTTSASAPVFSAVSQTGFTLSWTNGDGSGRLVLVKAGSEVDANPADATDYGVNSIFGTGDELGTGNFAVFEGSGSSVAITGLTAGTTYHISVFEYNGSGASSNYKIGSPATGSQATTPLGLTPPTLTADATLNTVDNNIDITFDNETWRAAITDVNIDGTPLNPLDYDKTIVGTLRLKPSNGNALLTTSGSKAVTVVATGYNIASVSQDINAGVPTGNSTATIEVALALGADRLITVTGRDQFNNLVSSGHTFKYDATITNNDGTTPEGYNIDGADRTSSATDVDIVLATNSSGVATFHIIIPGVVDENDGVSVQVQLTDGSTNIGTAFSFTKLSPSVLSAGDIAILAAQTTNPDYLSFILLKEVNPATVVNITDNGWRSTGGFRNNEGTITWTSPSTRLPVGTQINILPASTSVNVGTISPPGNFAVSSTDQVLIYQGSDPYTFITAINIGGDWASNAIDANTSAIPSGLTNGTNCLFINQGNGYYSSSLSGTVATDRSRINNSNSWTLSGSAQSVPYYGNTNTVTISNVSQTSNNLSSNALSNITFSGLSTTGSLVVNQYYNPPIGSAGISETNVGSYRWVINNSGVIFSGASFRFDIFRLPGNGGISENAADIKLYKRSTEGSGSWTLVGTFTYNNNGTPGTLTDDFLTISGITSFSEFVMASESSPLPVELTSFTARAAGSVVNLNWETATEVDNNGFDVERNSTGTWQKIGFVEGHGTANSPKYYNFTDKSVTGNKIQYRLRQVDNDGTFEYSNVVEVELAPTTFTLDQNYPNPFNPATMIRFSLPTASVVTLNVYNTLGEKVVTLLNGVMESGYHQVSFDAANLPSGLYLYEIKAGEFSSIKKMLLMK